MRGLRLVAPATLLALVTQVAACGDDSASDTSATTEPSGSTGATGGGSPGAGGSSSTGPEPGAGGGGATSTSSGQGGEAPCTAGTVLCEGTTQRVCDGEGGFTDEEDCDPGACLPGVGCTLCIPGTGVCEGETSTVCDDDGMSFTTYTCDPVQGVTCDADTGHCVGACAPEGLGTSYIGCDYYPTITMNDFLDPSFHFAVAIANTSDEVAEFVIERGATEVLAGTVAPDSVGVFNLPWVEELRLANVTTLEAEGAYRVRTTQPVTVYQYNPVEYTLDGEDRSATNDASLLLPTNAWTGTYRVVARNSFFDSPGFYAVTAKEDGTTVVLSPSATGGAVRSGGGVAADGTGTVVLDAGDVLQVLSATDDEEIQSTDLTGTLVTADKPVQVLGGHNCIYIPTDVGFCDHLEESMVPVETLADEYVVTPPLSSSGFVDLQFVRIVATEDGTALIYDPPQAGAPSTLANAGDYVEIPQSGADFQITSSRPVLVAQYMRGQGEFGNDGDPSMTLAVATEQYRDSYLFHAPTSYSSNYVNVTAPIGASITLDGGVLPPLTPIGTSGFGVVRITLANGANGNHEIKGSAPFGISVYGYGADTSYWYPGGLDLDKLSSN
jgi:hypothetical protein